MKRFIYAAVAAVMMLSGCEYHPYYDGQEFCILDKEAGVIRTDGVHIYVPMKDRDPYVLEFYGGAGENHSVTVEDPELLDYMYEGSDVRKTLLDGLEVIPANVVLTPKRTGDTSITIKDLDSDASITIYVTVCDSYMAMEVSEGNSTFETGTVFAFTYGGEDDIVKICRGSVSDRDVVHIVDGRYEFVTEDGILYFEFRFPADESGRPSQNGSEIYKRYQVRHRGGQLDDWSYMLDLLNLLDYPCVTKGYFVPEYYDVELRFADVTDFEEPPTEDEAEYDSFLARSARIFPWIEK